MGRQSVERCGANIYRLCAPFSNLCGCVILLVLGSIPNSADPMVVLLFF